MCRYFLERAGYYYENWDEIYDNWVAKAEDCIARLRAIELTPLPEVEPMEMVTSRSGVTSGWELLGTY